LAATPSRHKQSHALTLIELPWHCTLHPKLCQHRHVSTLRLKVGGYYLGFMTFWIPPPRGASQRLLSHPHHRGAINPVRVTPT
jgi:hypothetical protein